MVSSTVSDDALTLSFLIEDISFSFLISLLSICSSFSSGGEDDIVTVVTIFEVDTVGAVLLINNFSLILSGALQLQRELVCSLLLIDLLELAFINSSTLLVPILSGPCSLICSTIILLVPTE